MTERKYNYSPINRQIIVLDKNFERVHLFHFYEGLLKWGKKSISYNNRKKIRNKIIVFYGEYYLINAQAFYEYNYSFESEEITRLHHEKITEVIIGRREEKVIVIFDKDLNFSEMYFGLLLELSKREGIRANNLNIHLMDYRKILFKALLGLPRKGKIKNVYIYWKDFIKFKVELEEIKYDINTLLNIELK